MGWLRAQAAASSCVRSLASSSVTSLVKLLVTSSATSCQLDDAWDLETTSALLSASVSKHTTDVRHKCKARNLQVAI